MADSHTELRVAADVGGTFTDIAMISAKGEVWTHKLPSTPPHFERAVLEGVRHLLRAAQATGSQVRECGHGTTVATNAVLEHRGALTALITTAGFRDVLELRRIRAPQLYDLFFEKPAPLVDRHLRLELAERVAADGEVIRGIERADLDRIRDTLVHEQVESVAVCLLHSYSFPDHERRVGEYLAAELPDVPVSLSCEVLPERREYERTATTAVNAYVRPVMSRYLQAMREGLDALQIDAPLLIMQSSGGLSPEAETARHPVFMLESGPAAGVLAASATAEALGIGNVITLDMGGTTAKASMVEEGQLSYSAQYEVGASLSSSSRLVGGGGELIRAPTIDIAEVGAGGGSIAYLDRAGGLRVGPQSAGAVPGPVCYQKGGEQATLTDANVVLGYIRPGPLADGEVEVSAELAAQAVGGQIAGPLDIDLLSAAHGIHRIANAQTMRALREVSTERGRDPRDFALIAFGGAGPIHAAGLARELGIGRVVVPPLPGLFSALGLLSSGIEHHGVRSCQLTGATLAAPGLEELRRELSDELVERFAAEGFGADEVSIDYRADMRFRGQTSELHLPIAGSAAGPAEAPFTEATVTQLQLDFADEHERLYGHRSDPDNPLEVTALRAIGRAGVPEATHRLEPAEVDATPTSRRAYFGEEQGAMDTPVCHRRDLQQPRPGPLLIDEYDSTIVVPPGMSARLDDRLNVVVELIEPGERADG